MLETLHVRNFAIIDEVVVDFAQGMNVLTGETGAGKSILVDALGLVLGARASADVVRAGAERADITAGFAVTEDSPASAWLAAQELDDGETCLLRRVIGRDGRSRGFINGNPAPIGSLRALGALLVAIHGQHEHQTLQQPERQRDMLDARGGLSRQRDSVAAAHATWESAETGLADLLAARAQREERLALLEFQLRELDAVAPEAGELDSLQPEHARLANAGRLAEGSNEALAALYDREPANVQGLLAEAARALQDIVAYDDSLAPAVTLVSEAEVSVAEAAEVLRRYAADIEADPVRLEQVESRIAALDALARKHSVDVAALPEHVSTLRAQRDQLADADQQIDALIAERDAARAALDKAADALTKARRKAAKAFATEVTTGMNGLGMPGGRFSVRVDDAGRDVPAAHGADRIVFEVSANPGQPPQPVSRVASGGELSRISLAIQAAAGRTDRLPCMIFDEVDSGVGGAVAEIVGREMRTLADACQVLAVTHLPQVAGQAHHHLRVSKMTDGKTTRTTIAPLRDDARVEEIARMLGGVDITDTSREHAREMLRAGSA
ncbi:MAG: DNA repair protein RecN [Pseudomonadota bacterium]